MLGSRGSGDRIKHQFRITVTQEDHSTTNDTGEVENNIAAETDDGTLDHVKNGPDDVIARMEHTHNHLNDMADVLTDVSLKTDDIFFSFSSQSDSPDDIDIDQDDSIVEEKRKEEDKGVISDNRTRQDDNTLMVSPRVAQVKSKLEIEANAEKVSKYHDNCMFFDNPGTVWDGSLEYLGQLLFSCPDSKLMFWYGIGMLLYCPVESLLFSCLG